MSQAITPSLLCRAPAVFHTLPHWSIPSVQRGEGGFLQQGSEQGETRVLRWRYGSCRSFCSTGMRYQARDTGSITASTGSIPHSAALAIVDTICVERLHRQYIDHRRYLQKKNNNSGCELEDRTGIMEELNRHYRGVPTTEADFFGRGSSRLKSSVLFLEDVVISSSELTITDFYKIVGLTLTLTP